MIGIIKNRLGANAASWLLSGAGDDMIALHEQDGCFAHVSDSIRDLLGREPAELIGRPVTDILVPADRGPILSLIARAAATGEKGRADCRLFRADGTIAWTEMAVSADRSGRVRSIIRDIGDRQARDRENSAARQRAEQEAESRAGYLADLSHEIRTPLSAMIGFADMMRNETFGPLGHDKYGEYAELIHASGQHLLSLISDLLDMAKLDAGKFTLDREPADLAAIVEECAGITRLGAEQAGLVLKTDIATGLPPVSIDARALRQIILNLLSNAIKFTEEGGVTIRLRHDDSHIWLSVIDTGIGMDAADLDRIGERFEQAHREGVRGTRGTGLGLALSQALAELHGGELRLASEPGAGTKAVICLPRIDVLDAAGQPDNETSTGDDTVSALDRVKWAQRTRTEVGSSGNSDAFAALGSQLSDALVPHKAAS